MVIHMHREKDQAKKKSVTIFVRGECRQLTLFDICFFFSSFGLQAKTIQKPKLKNKIGNELAIERIQSL